jgi:L-threonylcarbamoyladenylate synthase
VAQELLRAFGGGIAAPSANRFGRVSPTCAEHVHAELAGQIDLILDGGPCRVGLESTIVDLSRGSPSVLRPGAITAEQLRAVLGELPWPPKDDAPRVSGSLESHYAPYARVELVAAADIVGQATHLLAQGRRVAVMCQASMRSSLPPGVMAIVIPADAGELAHKLYSLLRQADEQHCEVVLTTLPAEDGIGAAIADRLRKAAGQRQAR